MKEFLLSVAGAVVAVLVTVILGTVWDKTQAGGLIKALGGATSEEVRDLVTQTSDNRKLITAIGSQRLSCKTLVAEEFQPYQECQSQYFELARWCSGDCNADDAKATMCCQNTNMN
ncbi:MAG: hypothetical protein OXF20_01125 [Gammaproteobacteria bacterium]|nr:hypothetical protein [Gammaproteobacteria bacterium]